MAPLTYVLVDGIDARYGAVGYGFPKLTVLPAHESRPAGQDVRQDF